MKLHIYSIYDTLACVFNKPFTDINDASAERSFKQSAPEQPHIKDYELFRLASLNDTSGEIIPEKNPVKVTTGIQVVAQLTNENQD